MSKRNVYVENSVNETTGEVFEKRWITKQPAKNYKFIKFYKYNVSSLTNIQLRVLYEICMHTEYNTNKVFLDKSKKEEISKDSRVKRLMNIVKTLTYLKLLYKENQFAYIVSPFFAFNGEEVEKENVINLIKEI